jgi:hypothetical protein
MFNEDDFFQCYRRQHRRKLHDNTKPYPRQGAEPPSRKLMYNCAGCGSTHGESRPIQQSMRIRADLLRRLFAACWRSFDSLPLKPGGEAGTLDHIKLSTVIKAFKERRPEAPPSLTSSITVDDRKNAVRANNIDIIAMARSVPEVKTVHTVEEKLRLRPDMRYLIDWCIGWMQSDRAAGRTPIFNRMEDEWTQRKLSETECIPPAFR